MNYGERIAEMFMEGGEMTRKEIGQAFFSDQDWDKKLEGKVEFYLTSARKVLAKRGLFLTNAAKTGGVYRLLDDSNEVLGRVKGGLRRAEGGQLVMNAGKEYLELKGDEKDLVKAVDIMTSFMMKSAKQFFLQLNSSKQIIAEREAEILQLKNRLNEIAHD